MKYYYLIYYFFISLVLKFIMYALLLNSFDFLFDDKPFKFTKLLLPLIFVISSLVMKCYNYFKCKKLGINFYNALVNGNMETTIHTTQSLVDILPKLKEDKLIKRSKITDNTNENIPSISIKPYSVMHKNELALVQTSEQSITIQYQEKTKHHFIQKYFPIFSFNIANVLRQIIAIEKVIAS